MLKRARRSLYIVAAIVAAAMVAAPSGALAQPSPWRAFSDPFFHPLFRDVDDAPIGIPHAIARDGRGFVWVGYLEGLARWDGVEFRTYSAEATGKGPELPEPSVSSLHADAGGQLWIGLHSQGLVRYDAVRDAFVRPVNRTPLDHAAVAELADAADGGLWVASNAGLGHVDRAGAVRVDRQGWLARGLEHVAASASGVL